MSQPTAPTTGMAAPTIGAHSIGTKRATVHSTSSATRTMARASQDRRTIRLIQSRRR